MGDPVKPSSAVCILAAVGVIATRRFFDTRAIGGGLPEPGSALDIDRRILANTVEQAMLALPAYAAAAVTLPMEDMPRIGACAMAFVAGRIAFAIGYHIAPPFRAFGFALTFYSSAALYAWLAWELIIPTDARHARRNRGAITCHHRSGSPVNATMVESAAKTMMSGWLKSSRSL